MPRPRFSKSGMLLYLRESIKAVRERNNFDPNNGTHQLKRKHNMSGYTEEDMSRAMEYGRMMAMQQILDDLDNT